MPPIVADLTLGALAATVVLMVTIVFAAIVLATTGLATGRLAIVGSGVALATIRVAIATVARARLIGAGWRGAPAGNSGARGRPGLE
jgi:hypothetical protein